MSSQDDSLQYGLAPKNSFLELGIRITTLERETIDRLQTITDEINDQMSTLENQIPTLPISSENVYYTDMQNNTKMLDIYLKNIDIFKEQMLLILQNINKDIKNLQETPVSDSIVLPISAADVNYTKPDENIIPLDTYLENIVTGIQTLEENSENYLPKVPYKVQIDTYLPVVPNTFCTYSDTTTPNKTATSLFNFFL
jgi:hypothetical protein